MTKRIRLVRNTVLDDGPHDVGWEGEVSDRDGNMLVAIGKAELVTDEAAAASSEPEEAPEAAAEKAEAREGTVATAVPGGKRTGKKAGK